MNIPVVLIECSFNNFLKTLAQNYLEIIHGTFFLKRFSWFQEHLHNQENTCFYSLSKKKKIDLSVQRIFRNNVL